VILYALAAHVYPTLVRATGVGASAGIGRLGAVLSSFIGAAVLSTAGAPGFYIVIALAMVTVAIAIALVRRHVTIER
jgi:AAHS family 4-hydroxybenzoate transporter-like MFS transporter